MTSPSTESTGTFPDNQEMSKCRLRAKKIAFPHQKAKQRSFFSNQVHLLCWWYYWCWKLAMNWGTLDGKFLYEILKLWTLCVNGYSCLPD